MPRVLHTLSHLTNGRLTQDQKSFQISANENKVGLPSHVHVLVPETQHPILGCRLQQTREFCRERRKPAPSSLSHPAESLSNYITQSWLFTGSCESAEHLFGSCDLLEYIWYPQKGCSYLALLILITNPTGSQGTGSSGVTCSGMTEAVMKST